MGDVADLSAHREAHKPENQYCYECPVAGASTSCLRPDREDSVFAIVSEIKPRLIWGEFFRSATINPPDQTWTDPLRTNARRPRREVSDKGAWVEAMDEGGAARSTAPHSWRTRTSRDFVWRNHGVVRNLHRPDELELRECRLWPRQSRDSAKKLLVEINLAKPQKRGLAMQTEVRPRLPATAAQAEGLKRLRKGAFRPEARSFRTSRTK